MESLQSDDSFFINGSFQNDKTYPVEASVIVVDDSTLLERSEGYGIHITRWSLDTQSSLFYLKANAANQVCVELLYTDDGATMWAQHRSFCFTLTDNMPTLTSFVHWWNGHQRVTDPIFPQLKIDSAGRFLIEPVYSEAVDFLGVHPGGTGDHSVRIQMSDSMTDLLDFDRLHSTILYHVQAKRKVGEALDFLAEVVREDRQDFYLQYQLDAHGVLFPRYHQALRTISGHCIRFTDNVVHDAINGDSSYITSTLAHDSEHRIPDGRWGKLFWEERHGIIHRHMSQYMYVQAFVQLGIGAAAETEYEAGGWQGQPDEAGTLGFSYVDPADGARKSVYWDRKHATPAHPRVFADEFIDMDMCFGRDKPATYLSAACDIVNPFITLPANVDVAIGDLIEIPFSHGGIAFFDDGTVPRLGTTNGFVDQGVFHSIPVVGVTSTAANTLVELAVPIPPVTATALNLTLVGAAAGHVPTVFITQKRPAFIPHSHLFTVAVVIGPVDGVITISLLGATPARVGDHIYTKVDDVMYGPFPVTGRTYNNPGGVVSPSISVTIDAVGWPGAYDANNIAHHVYLVNQGMVEWYLEDIKRLKAVFPAHICMQQKTQDWGVGVGPHNVTGHQVADELALDIKAVFDADELFSTVLAVRPDMEDLRLEDAPEIIPAMMTTGPDRNLVLKNVVVEVAAPHVQFMFPLESRRYAARHGFNYGFAILNVPEVSAFVEVHPNENLQLDPVPGPAPVAPAWVQGHSCTVCGVIDQGTLLYAFEGGFGLGAAEQDPATITSTTLVPLQGLGGKIHTMLLKGNTELSLKLPGSSSGRLLNMLQHDYIRSMTQGHIDLCQHYGSILITSRDIGVRPEKSNARNSLSPIISSFTIPSTIKAFSCDSHGNVQGYSESPYGTIRFSERGQRRYHKLQQIPGDLRSFVISAEVAPRDLRLSPERIMLGPGEQFSWQIIFVKNF